MNEHEEAFDEHIKLLNSVLCGTDAEMISNSIIFLASVLDNKLFDIERSINESTEVLREIKTQLWKNG